MKILRRDFHETSESLYFLRMARFYKDKLCMAKFYRDEEDDCNICRWKENMRGFARQAVAHARYNAKMRVDRVVNIK